MKSSLFTDATGREYQLDQIRDEELWVFKVLTRGFSTIGYANCMNGSRGDLVLADIVIHEQVKSPYRIWPLCLILKTQPRSFQGLGIGSALLDHILRAARKEGFDRVSGKIHLRDLREKPWLPDWYRRFGFSSTRNGDGYLIERCF